jgi:formylglycine-generating enzyme required for sulfatase activity
MSYLMSEPRGFALLIGVSDYTDDNLEQLVAPARDVADLHRVLTDPDIGNFQAEEPLLNPTFKEMRRAIASFFKDKRRDALLLLYFSGHGVIDQADGNFYLASPETEVDDPSVLGLPSAFITTQLNRHKLMRVILILDCCYSGRFVRGMKASVPLDVDHIFRSSFGRTVLTASRPSERAWDGGELYDADDKLIEHSLFTHYLIEGLESGLDGSHSSPYITIEDLYSYAHQRVANTRKHKEQHPQCSLTDQEGLPLVIAQNPNPALAEDLEDSVVESQKSSTGRPSFVLYASIGLILLLVMAVLWPGDGPNPEPTPVLTASPTSNPTPMEEIAQLPSSTYEAGYKWSRPQDEMTVLYVPEGEFLMGSNWDASEQPVHKVVLDAFWIDETEVTNGQYQECVNADVCKSLPFCSAPGTESFGTASQMLNHPVTCVDWESASTYCEWVDGRLPTESEWEYAARGSEGHSYPWGSAFDGTKLNYCDASCSFSHAGQTTDDGYAQTAPVGSYPSSASWCGALDMAGNVWEWVADWYGPYDTVRRRNPDGAATGESRILRGGSWSAVYQFARSTDRYEAEPSAASPFTGFRCVMDSNR